MSQTDSSTPSLRKRLVAQLLHCYPLYSGCGTAAARPIVRKLAGPGEGEVWARIEGGQKLRVKLGDYEGWAIYFTGDWDRKITWLCRNLVDPGDTVLDVGTNLGRVTLCLAHAVGPTGHVHAFEPNPEMLRLLRQSLEANSVRQVRLYPVALGDEEAELALHVPSHHAGLGTLVEASARANADQVMVQVRPLSVVAQEHAIGQARLVKIDVEGFEAKVLAGAEAWFDQQPPDMVLFEYDPTDQPLNESPVVNWLNARGYELLAIPRCLLRMRLERVDLAKAGHPHCHDYLAVRNGPPLERVSQRVRITD